MPLSNTCGISIIISHFKYMHLSFYIMWSVDPTIVKNLHALKRRMYKTNARDTFSSSLHI